MALIDCPKCGRPISDKAKECPGCGWLAKQSDGDRPAIEVEVPRSRVDSARKVRSWPLAPIVASAAVTAALAGVVLFALHSAQVICLHSWTMSGEGERCIACGAVRGGSALSQGSNSATAAEGIADEEGAAQAGVSGGTSTKDDGELNVIDGVGSESVIEPGGDWADSFSYQTGDETYPFAVTNEDFPPEGIGALAPLEKLSSSYPFQINLADAETTDSLPGIGFCMADDYGGYSYDYELKQVETTEITILDRNGEKRKAMVNTKLALTGLIGERDDKERLISQNCYLLKDENGEVYMAIPDLEGGDNYVLYC